MAITQCLRLLVVNPNTSTAITDDLKPLLHHLESTQLSFFTSPDGPPILASSEDIACSTAHSLAPLLALADQYDGFLIACYADHPLTQLLVEMLPIPVMGIFEASVHTALDLLSPCGKFGIVTTGHFYEAQLSHGVRKMLKRAERDSAVFAGVAATGISPEKLRSETTEEIRARVVASTRRILSAGDVEVICVGGVILAGIEGWIRETCIAELGWERGGKVVVVEQMRAGMKCLLQCIEAVSH